MIVGCSWGAGEWSNLQIRHGGLAQYLQESGHDVINLSVGGSSNYASLLRLKLFFDSHTNMYLKQPLGSKDKILFFQTEWHRDYLNDILGIHRHISNLPNDLEQVDVQTVCNLYYRLSELAQQYSVEIYLIGGCSDTIWLDKFEQEYPGLHIACQSMTNLCINDKHRIDSDNVFLGGITAPVAEYMRLHNNAAQTTKKILHLAHQYQVRHQLWKNHKQWFWPDGVHANRQAHLKLFQWLQNNSMID